jgi:hypothetical protein
VSFTWNDIQISLDGHATLSTTLFVYIIEVLCGYINTNLLSQFLYFIPCLTNRNSLYLIDKIKNKTQKVELKIFIYMISFVNYTQFSTSTSRGQKLCLNPIDPSLHQNPVDIYCLYQLSFSHKFSNYFNFFKFPIMST